MLLSAVVVELPALKPIKVLSLPVVNPDPLDTKEVTKILDQFGMWNPNWKFIDYEGLKEHIKTNRSNCILSTEKSKEVGIEFPTERESLHRILSPKNEE